MDMKQLLTRLTALSEAETDVLNPTFQSQTGKQATQAAPQPAPSMQQTANAMDQQAASKLSNQDQVNKNNLVKKLYDLLTQLTQAKTPKQSAQPAAESYKSSIAKAIMESFELYEADAPQLSQTGEVAKITAEIDAVMKQLQPFAQDPDVQKAFQQVEKIKSANYAQAAPYKGGATPENVKRFIELTNKIGGGGAAAPMGSTGQQSTGQQATPSSTQSGSHQSTSPQSVQSGGADVGLPTKLSAATIKQLQQKLNATGEKLKIDGVIGKNTKEAMGRHPEILKSMMPSSGNSLQDWIPSFNLPPQLGGPVTSTTRIK